MSLLFLDTEFSGLDQQADLLSLALVDTSGKWFYAHFNEVDPAGLGDWHQTHVVPYLALSPAQLRALDPAGTYVSGSTAVIVERLRAWLSACGPVAIWADVPAYDWVLFCELFGGAMEIPENVHYIVRDLATYLAVSGVDPDIDRYAYAFGKGGAPAGLPRHNALGDAFCARAIHRKLRGG